MAPRIVFALLLMAAAVLAAEGRSPGRLQRIANRKLQQTLGIRTGAQMQSSMILPSAQIPAAGVLDPACINKYVEALPLPGAYKPSASYTTYDEYKISVKSIMQQVLPTTLKVAPGQCPAWTAATARKTPVLAYGPTGGTAFGWPSLTVEAVRGRAVAIQFTNEIANLTSFLPHPYKEAIDQTLHWANPGKLGGATDISPCRACLTAMAAGNSSACLGDAACVKATTTYEGPVPIITHVHGQTDVGDHSDGYTEAWYNPALSTANAKLWAQNGTWSKTFEKLFMKYDTSFTYSKAKYAPGVASHWYSNSQRPTVQFYHDHALGITRLNVYAGMAGFWLIRSKTPSTLGPDDMTGMPYPAHTSGCAATAVREVPLAIQDRAFTQDGRFWYPTADYAPADKLPQGDLPPRWIPEMTATKTGQPVTDGAESAMMMMVNGKAWPVYNVVTDTYRLRILNGCNARTLVLYFSTELPQQVLPSPPPGLTNWAPANVSNLIRFYVSGSEGGNFPGIVGPIDRITMGPAYRNDILLDFSTFNVGQTVYLLNYGSETPWAGDNNGEGLTEHTAQVMAFYVSRKVSSTSKYSSDPAPIRLNAATLRTLNNGLYAGANKALPAPTKTRRVALIEDSNAANGYVLAQFLGSWNTATNSFTRQAWRNPIDIYPKTQTVEDWEIVNFTPDAHPMHMHEVHFEIVNRTSITVDPNTLTYAPTGVPFVTPLGDLERAPCACTTASMACPSPPPLCPILKDTVLAYPNTITRIRFNTGIKSGLYVWHCHLLEHEDNEMMRPWCIGKVTPSYYINPKTGLTMCPATNI